MTAVTGQTGALRRITQYVADAWLEIQTARRDWTFRWAEFSKTLTAGSQVYNLQTAIAGGQILLSTNQFTIEKASDNTTRHRLTLLDYSYFENLYGAQVIQAGNPLYMAIQPDGQNVKFDVTLDADYILKGKYLTAPQTLAANTDTPTGLPDAYHLAIFYRALMKWAEFEEAQQIYITARNSDMEWQARMANDLCPKVLFGGGPIA